MAFPEDTITSRDHLEILFKAHLQGVTTLVESIKTDLGGRIDDLQQHGCHRGAENATCIKHLSEEIKKVKDKPIKVARRDTVITSGTVAATLVIVLYVLSIFGPRVGVKERELEQIDKLLNRLAPIVITDEVAMDGVVVNE